MWWWCVVVVFAKKFVDVVKLASVDAGVGGGGG